VRLSVSQKIFNILLNTKSNIMREVNFKSSLFKITRIQCSLNVKWYTN